MNKLWLVAAGVLIPLAAYYGWMYVTGPTYVYGQLGRKNIGDVRSAEDKKAKRILVGGGVELYQDTVGEGGKGVFVLHGGPGKPYDDVWEGLPKQDEYTYHFYHQRGCGESTRAVHAVPSELSFPAAVDHVITRLGIDQDILDIERLRVAFGYDTVTLVGHSWGGFLAAMYAAEFPQNVEKLVLMSPAAMLVLPPLPEKDFFKEITSRLDAPNAKAFNDYVQNVVLDFSPGLWKKTDDQLVEEDKLFGEFYFKAMGNAPLPESRHRGGGWAIKGSFISLGMHHDYTQALKDITAPTLVLECANDMISEELYQTINGAQVATIPDSTHFPFVENPTALASELKSFL